MASGSPDLGVPREDEPGAEGALESSARSVPETTETAVSSWVWLDWGHSVYSTLGMSGFLPLLVQSQALAASGFPASCPNLVSNTSRLEEAFGSSAGVTQGFYTTIPLTSSCASTVPCVGNLCQGLPATVDQCRSADGSSVIALRTGGVDPTAISALFISLSVLAQAVVLMTFGPIADYGTLRRSQLYIWSVVGAIASAAAAITTPSTWWLTGTLMLVSNPAFGLVMVMGNAYLPLLVKNMPEVRAKRDDPEAKDGEYYELVLRKSDELSSRGFAWGYLGGVASIICVLPLTFFLDVVLVYQIAQVFAGLWWVTFVFGCSWRTLPTMPGPPFPKGSSVVGRSLSHTWSGLVMLRRLPVTGLLLVSWFLLSDGVFVIGSVGGIYANSLVDWGCIPKSLGVAGLFLLVPVFGSIGGYAFQALSVRLKWHSRTTVLWTVAVAAVIPVYGFLSYAPIAIGLRQGWEILAVGCVYGFSVGAFQAFFRSLFSTLIPRGHEGVLNSVYELADKGSSFLGPLVVSILQSSLNDMRPTMFYIFGMLLLGSIILGCLDVEKGVRDAAAYKDELTEAAADADALVEMTSVDNAAAQAVASARPEGETRLTGRAAGAAGVKAAAP